MGEGRREKWLRTPPRATRPRPVVLQWSHHRLESHCVDDKIQLTFSTTPAVSPVFLAGRAKGRLQHALRQAGAAFAGSSRQVSV
jgi:hypothetical protein